MYLPAGRWINYHTHEWVDSNGEHTASLQLRRDDVMRLPVYARAGAILPMMYVDEQTKDAFGNRLDGTRRDELVVKVFADSAPTEFLLYEDDGETVTRCTTRGAPGCRSALMDGSFALPSTLPRALLRVPAMPDKTSCAS